MYSPAVPTKDLAFTTPVGQGWPSSCWLSDGSGMEDKSEFMPTNTISVHYAYGVANGALTEAHTNRMFVLKRYLWNSETFDWADYLNGRYYYRLTNNAGIVLEANGVGCGDFTFSAKGLESGEYAVLIWLDCHNSVNETDETNNWMVKTFTVSVPQVTVTLDANGGTVSTKEFTVDMGGWLSLPRPERSGYTFDGWFTEDGAEVSSSHSVYADATYYAHWSPKEYMDVKFDANGGNCASSAVGIKRGNNITSLPLAWHTNLLFAGWWTAKEGGVQFKKYTRIDDDIQLYAHWVEDANHVVVTLDGNGGSVSYGNKHAVARGSGIVEFSRAYRNEYVLDGWFTEADGGTRVTSSTPVYSNVTWYAHWTKLALSTSRQLVFRFKEQRGCSMMVSDVFGTVDREVFSVSESIYAYHAYTWYNPSYSGNPTGCVQVVLLRQREGASKQFDIGDYEIMDLKARSVSAKTYGYWHYHPIGA